MNKYRNLHFKGYLLKEITPRAPQEASTSGISEDVFTKILGNFTEKKDDTSGNYNIRQII